MIRTATVPLDSILSSLFTTLKEHEISEYDVLEWAAEAMSIMHVGKSYQVGVCIQEVNNNMAIIPAGVIGIHHVRYMKNKENHEPIRLMLQNINFVTDKRLDMKRDGSPTLIPLSVEAMTQHEQEAWMHHNAHLYHDPNHNADGHHSYPVFPEGHPYHAVNGHIIIPPPPGSTSPYVHPINHPHANHNHPHSPHHHGHTHTSPWDFGRDIFWDKQRNYGYVTGVLSDVYMRQGGRFEEHGWQYLHISDQPFDASILCKGMYRPCQGCEDWWLPDIYKNRIITSFSEGYIAIVYYRHPVNEDGMFIIPDVPEFKQALISYVLMKLAEKRMWSKEEGSTQMYKLYSQRWSLFCMKAVAVLSTPDMNELINMDRNNTLFKDYDVRTLVMGNHRNETVKYVN